MKNIKIYIATVIIALLCNTGVYMGATTKTMPKDVNLILEFGQSNAEGIGRLYEVSADVLAKESYPKFQVFDSVSATFKDMNLWNGTSYEIQNITDVGDGTSIVSSTGHNMQTLRSVKISSSTDCDGVYKVNTTTEDYFTIQGTCSSGQTGLAIKSNAYLLAGQDFGPELGLARYLEESDPEKNFLVKYAIGGTGFADNSWNKGDDTYEAAKAKALLAIAQMEAMGYNPVITLMWWQGEDDTTATSTYAASEAQFFADIESDIGYPIKSILNYKVNPSSADRRTINSAKVTNATADTRIKIVETGGLSINTDETHFDTNGQLMAGIYLGKLLKDSKAVLYDRGGYDIKISDVVGDGDYMSLNKTSTVEGEDKSFFVKAGTYTLTADLIIYEGQNWTFEETNGGVIINGGSAYSVKTYGSTVGAHVALYDSTLDPNNPAGKTTITKGGLNWSLSDVEANPTSYKFVHNGVAYDVESANDGTDSLVINDVVWGASASGLMTSVFKGLMSNVVMSGKLTVNSCDEAVNLTFLYKGDLSKLVADFSGSGVSVNYGSAGTDFGTVIYSNVASAVDSTLIGISGNGCRGTFYIQNVVMNSANNRSCASPYSGYGNNFTFYINNNTNIGAGSLGAIYTSQWNQKGILKGVVLQNEAGITYEVSNPWNITGLVT